MSVSILLADDHLVVRTGLRALLAVEHDFQVVGEAEDGAAVLKQLEALRPDVLVLDLMMPALGGFQVLRAIAERQLPTHVVVLSMYSSEAYVTEALRLGATGYVVKSSDADDLSRAVRQAAAGHRFLSAPLSDSIIETYAQRVRAASEDPYDKLTPREREVLMLAAHGHTAAEIASRLNISPRTGESHRANLMRKLGLRHQTDLIRYALRRGILDPNQ